MLLEAVSCRDRAVAEFSTPWQNRAVKNSQWHDLTCPRFTCESLPFVNLCYFFSAALRIWDKYGATEFVPDQSQWCKSQYRYLRCNKYLYNITLSIQLHAFCTAKRIFMKTEISCAEKKMSPSLKNLANFLFCPFEGTIINNAWKTVFNLN